VKRLFSSSSGVQQSLSLDLMAISVVFRPGVQGLRWENTEVPGFR
jgi:hypothetical protein